MKKKMDQQNTFILVYNPEENDPISLFKYFGIDELSLDSQCRFLVLSVQARLEKSSILWEHLLQLCKIANEKERDEIERYGYSGIKFSKLGSSIFEAILNDYYGIYSNFAVIFYKIFGVGSSKGKWFRLKNKAVKGDYPSLSPEIVDIFDSVNVDEKLREIRTESAHYSTGDLNLFSMPYSYMNPQIGPIGRTPSNVTLIEDIEEFYSQLRLGTSEFLNSFFKYVMGNLIEGTTQKNQFCGFYHGYLYQRVESYQDFITGKKGYCKPIWSESNSVAPPCPLAENCKAYKNYLSNQ